jgi:hypothetical protein
VLVCLSLVNFGHILEIFEEIMFENLTLLIIIIALFWLGAFGYYLYTSRQQKNIADDLNRLHEKLDESEKRK